MESCPRIWSGFLTKMSGVCEICRFTPAPHEDSMSEMRRKDTRFPVGANIYRCAYTLPALGIHFDMVLGYSLEHSSQVKGFPSVSRPNCGSNLKDSVQLAWVLPTQRCRCSSTTLELAQNWQVLAHCRPFAAFSSVFRAFQLRFDRSAFCLTCDEWR